MKNRFFNWLSAGRLEKAATIRKRLLVALAPGALAVAGAMMNHATPAKGAPPAQSQGKGGAPAQDVNVANPATAPVLAVNVNEMGRIPYQSMHTVTTIGDHQLLCPFSTVPSGHRLVVQHVSGQMFFNPPAAVTVTLTNLVDYTQLRSIFSVPNPQAFDQPVLVYYDAGENPLVIITTDSQSDSQLQNFVGVTMTGYLVDCSIGPCAAIAN
jgi:hypothetical protein